MISKEPAKALNPTYTKEVEDLACVVTKCLYHMNCAQNLKLLTCKSDKPIPIQNMEAAFILPTKIKRIVIFLLF